jgi:RecA-family ATPase
MVREPLAERPRLVGVVGVSGLVCVAHVDREPVRWLWPGRIPLGKLTVLDGDPGVGKSTLTLTIAAKVTTGSPFPDGARPDPADVILLSAEDDIGDTIRPRLEAAGADLERAWVLPDVQEDGEPPRPPELPADLDRLEALVKDQAAALVVIDPLMAFLAGAVDAHRDQDVRRVLARMAYMAARTESGGADRPAHEQGHRRLAAVPGRRVHRHHRRGPLRAAGRARP